MANPARVACTADSWTKVATNVTTGNLEVTKDIVKHRVTWVATGDPAPTLISEGDALYNEVEIRSSVAIDVYVWAKTSAGEVRLGGSSKIVGDGGVTVASTLVGTSDVNLSEVGGTAVNVDGGNSDGGTQTVVLADDDPAVTLLGTIDTDTGVMALWDDGSSHADTVDPYKPQKEVGTAVSGAIAVTANPAVPFEVDHITVHMGGAPVAAGSLTVTLTAFDGAAYNTLLFTLSMIGVTDLVIPGDELTGRQFVSGDQIAVAYANSNNETYGVRIMWKQV